jgi:murein DD-endopeptidase MepM/ murein hydrolase activator NlpD
MSRQTQSLFIIIPVLVLLGTGYWVYKSLRGDNLRMRQVVSWLGNPASHPEWLVKAGQRCGDAPFLIPTDGFIGFIWDDSFRAGHRHQGIDIFGGQEVNVTPVYAAYPGYLSREPDWKSSLIVRIPQDPLQPGRQIWTYYTHMADPDGASFISPEFPPGTQEVFVEAGALLGYQGNYSGTPGNPVGVHLHFSIVQDDGSGRFLNELEIENTLDPSPYLGLPLNARLNRVQIPVCAG